MPQDDLELAELLTPPPGGTGAPDRTLRYGPHPSQVVDLYGGPGAPGVVLLHGGFWREAYDRTHLVPFARALAGRGTGVALVEYRRVGGGGGWPATPDDVTAALDALAALPGARPAVLAGHSAGGHLALWAAARDTGRVARTVAVAPVADLARAHELRLSRGAVAELLGDRTAALLPLADPMALPRPPAPVLLVHGTADGQVPPHLSESYALRHDARLVRLPDVGHYAPFTPGTPACSWLLSEVMGGGSVPVSRA
ncbi:alpha/beta hydrolase family protein [Streptomyces sp. MS19]|uniref:alpha/beta hydrolase family protein n=1 Tax=Streptomyces sp. MS19 TaxID=3385972 RepID=UPI0039A1D44B